MMKCKICHSISNYIFESYMLNKYKVNYYYCDNCEFLQTEEPFWLDESYAKPINCLDTGYVERNLYYSKIITILFGIIFKKNSKFLDYAGGYGLFVRIMRDIGLDYYWDDKYTKNIFSTFFEFENDIIVEAITVFEAFEHFNNPIEEIEKILMISKNIFFSTEILPKPIPKPEEWWYYGLEHGQHISFYSSKTLDYISNKYGLYYYNINNLHIFSKRKLNIFFLKLLLFNKFYLFRFLKFKLKSKTLRDHKLIKDSLNN